MLKFLLSTSKLTMNNQEYFNIKRGQKQNTHDVTNRAAKSKNISVISHINEIK